MLCPSSFSWLRPPSIASHSPSDQTFDFLYKCNQSIGLDISALSARSEAVCLAGRRCCPRGRSAPRGTASSISARAHRPPKSRMGLMTVRCEVRIPICAPGASLLHPLRSPFRSSFLDPPSSLRDDSSSSDLPDAPQAHPLQSARQHRFLHLHRFQFLLRLGLLRKQRRR